MGMTTGVVARDLRCGVAGSRKRLRQVERTTLTQRGAVWRRSISRWRMAPKAGDTADVLRAVSTEAFKVASEWLGMLDHPVALRDGVRLAPFARKVERLANEAEKLGI